MRNRFFLQVTFYTLIIFGVMYWSGFSTEKRLYDSFRVTLDGAVLPVTDTSRATSFYSEVLDFEPLYSGSSESKSNTVGVMVPGGGQLLFRVQKNFAETQQIQESPAVVIRVRNGFTELHKRLVQRSGKEAFAQNDLRSGAVEYLAILPPGRVSGISTKDWGREFVVSDFDGNRLLFHETKKH